MIFRIPVEPDEPITGHQLADDFLHQAYDLIGCRMIERVAARFGTTEFDIWIDENGLFVEQPTLNIRATAFAGPGYQLVGVAVITGHDGPETTDCPERLARFMGVLGCEEVSDGGTDPLDQAPHP